MIWEIITIKEGEHLAVEFSSRQGADWFISALTIRPAAPLIAHSPAVLKPGFSQVFQATVTGVNPVTGVTLHYQAAAAGGYAQTPMRPAGNGLYRCELPPPATADGKITAYYITAFDNEGGEAACGSPEAPLTPRWQRPVRQIPYLIHHPPEKISPQPGSAYGAQPITVTSRNPGRSKISLCYRLLREKKPPSCPWLTGKICRGNSRSFPPRATAGLLFPGHYRRQRRFYPPRPLALPPLLHGGN